MRTNLPPRERCFSGSVGNPPQFLYEGLPVIGCNEVNFERLATPYLSLSTRLQQCRIELRAHDLGIPLQGTGSRPWPQRFYAGWKAKDQIGRASCRERV